MSTDEPKSQLWSLAGSIAKEYVMIVGGSRSARVSLDDHGLYDEQRATLFFSRNRSLQDRDGTFRACVILKNKACPSAHHGIMKGWLYRFRLP